MDRTVASQQQELLGSATGSHSAPYYVEFACSPMSVWAFSNTPVSSHTPKTSMIRLIRHSKFPLGVSVGVHGACVCVCVCPSRFCSCYRIKEGMIIANR